MNVAHTVVCVCDVNAVIFDMIHGSKVLSGFLGAPGEQCQAFGKG